MKNFYLTIALVLGLFLQLNAALVTWTGGGAAGDWNDPLNWDLGVPGPADDAVISGSSSVVTLTGAAAVASLEIKSNASFTVAAGAIITLGNDTGSSTNGSLDLDTAGGMITNNGTINVVNAAEDGIAVKGTFINNGVISVDGFGDDGVAIAGGFFTNSATGTIAVTNGTSAVSDSDYILVDNNSSTGPGSFTNDGLIDILMTMGDDGIELTDASTFDNNATINIVATGGDMGVRTNKTGSTFNNNVNGILNITGTPDDAVIVESGSAINNAGFILITDSGDHATEVSGTFNNLAGSTYKAVNSFDDGIRVRPGGAGSNAGTIIIDGFGADGIEVETGSTFAHGGALEIGCGDTKSELEIKCNQDLGATCITFDICGTDQGVTYDFLDNFSGSDCPDSQIDISAATAKLDFGTYVPVLGDCFNIVDGGGFVTGTFAAITVSNPAICFEVEYTATDVNVCILGKALAVDLISFKGAKSARGATLSWETSSETNNAGFEIERSADARNWTKLAYVAGNGNSTETIAYNHVDTAPAAGTNYYRLKQIDFDGAYEYTEGVVLDFERTTETTFTFYPNPVKEVLIINTDQAIDTDNVQIRLFDNAGKLILENQGMMNTIPFGTYDAGVYFIHINNGQTETIQKIVK